VCVDLAERAAQQANGPLKAEGLDRFEREHNNFRAALAWSEDAASDPQLGLRLASALANTFWPIRGYLHEGRSWLTRTLARSSERTALRAGVLDRAGYLALRQNDYLAASTSLDEALGIWRELGDKLGMAATLRNLGTVSHHQNDYQQAEHLLRDSLQLSRETGDRYSVGVSLRYFADLALDRAEYAEAIAAYEESLSVARMLNDAHGVAYALRGMGHMDRAQGEYPRARQRLRESLRLLNALRDRRCIPLCLEGLACTTVGPNWAERATRLLGAAQALQRTTGAPAPPREMADYQRTEADARAVLGDVRFESLLADGAALSLDAIMAYALIEAETIEAAENVAPGSDLTRPATAHPEFPSPAGGERRTGPLLTTREREVMVLIAEGLSNRQIAERLTLSLRTVERHIENIYNRLGISGKAGRAIVTAYAVRHDLIVPS
jgi:ATP/maltotriose-dependent transcriptional regulator MalT